jgi:DNA-binding GntR family transcriptional regulator
MQRRGFRVALYSEREIRDLYLLRAELEAYSISQLTECENMAPLVAELEAFHANMIRGDSRDGALDYLTQVREFFGAIVRYNQNNPLSTTLTKLNERCEPLRHTLLRHGLTKAEVATCVAGEILDAVKQRDFAKAACTRRKYARTHLPMILQAYTEAAYSEASGGSQAS